MPSIYLQNVYSDTCLIRAIHRPYEKLDNNEIASETQSFNQILYYLF